MRDQPLCGHLVSDDDNARTATTAFNVGSGAALSATTAPRVRYTALARCTVDSLAPSTRTTRTLRVACLVCAATTTARIGRCGCCDPVARRPSATVATSIGRCVCSYCPYAATAATCPDRRVGAC